MQHPGFSAKGQSRMKDQNQAKAQLKKKVLDKISENDGEIVYNDASFVKARFPYSKMQQAVRTYLEITKRLNQKAELFGGTRLTVFLT
jgi:hypothetical protein